MPKKPDEWWDKSWTLVAGCTWPDGKMPPGCKRCWARAMARRFRREQLEDVKTLHQNLELPLQTKRPTVFACQISYGDLFHQEVPDEFIIEALAIMAVTGAEDPLATPGQACFMKASETRRLEEPSEKHPNGVTHIGMKVHWRGGPHTFVLVTKRPERAACLIRRSQEEVAGAAYLWSTNRRDAGYLSDCISASERPWAPGRSNRLWPLPNVIVLASVWDQASTRVARDALSGLPRGWRWGLHMEPLLGPATLLTEAQWSDLDNVPRSEMHLPSWVVVGGETGPGARPMHPDWASSIQRQCEAAEIPFWFKSWGEWSPSGCAGTTIDFDGTTMYRAGKKNTGRQLDGREWSETPWAD